MRGNWNTLLPGDPECSMSMSDARLIADAFSSPEIMALAHRIDDLYSQTRTGAEQKTELVKAIALWDRARRERIVALESQLIDALSRSAKTPNPQSD